jgi:hypothetical protein
VGKKLVGVLALAAALTLSFTVSPAGAGSSGAAAEASEFCGASIFNSLDTLAASSTARGGITREPALIQTAEEVAPQRGRGSQFRATVPTWFHIVHHADGTGNVSNQAVRDQLAVLNEGFAGGEGGVNTGFRFSLAGITRTANTEWYLAGPTTSGERAMKRALKRGGDDTMNVYLTTAGVYLGWAYFPSIVEQPGNSYLDGIVVDWESMVNTSDRYEGRFDEGKTATHEAGHWLNLHHTFNGGCNNFGDYVSDTPPMLVPTSRCPIGKDTCSEPGLDPIHNYMDYSDDPCYNQFTQGQALRAQDAWLEWRA